MPKMPRPFMTVGKSLKFLKSRISVVVAMISIVSYVFWDEKSIPYDNKTLKSSLDGPRPRPCSYMGIITDIFKFNKGVV